MKKYVSILLTFVMIITVTSCANVQKSNWQEHLDLGQKYLLDGDYEQAIIEFNKVIEIEPKNADAYLGLAEAYVAAGDYDSAISILEQGYAETEEQTLRDRINELRELTNAQTGAVTTSPISTDDPVTTSEDTENQEAESHKIKQVSLGWNYSAAITTDGSFYMWGDNFQGQLGNGTTESSYVPLKIMDNVVSVSLGNEHSAAITEDGSLYMWGYNESGQLGNGTSGGSWEDYDGGIDSNTPTKIMDNVVSVSLAGVHSAAITSDGSLYMWGDNSVGQLGNGTTEDGSIPIKIMDNVTSVSLGGNHSAAITTDGSLYMWGANWDGQLGNGTTEDSSIPIKIMDNVTSVSLGGSHSAAITADGSLYIWGYNNDGQLGNGTTERSNVPIKIMDNVTFVSLGSNHSAAVTTDGSLYMWGDNFFGQLGNGIRGGSSAEYDEGIDSNVPIKIMDNVVSISLGFVHSAAITKDGSLYLWGLGSLGNDTADDSNVPIKIEIPTE